MKQIMIKSFEHLQELVFENCFDEKTQRYRNNFIYRGLPNKDFKLLTKLNRICGHDLSLESNVIRSFTKYGFADINPNDSFWQILATGQHFGLPTRLLDWSYSPLVAAHFATVDIEEYDKDGVIYCLNTNTVNEKLPTCFKEEVKNTRSSVFTISNIDKYAKNIKELEAIDEKPFVLFFEPASGDNRMINQYALFSLISNPYYSIEDLVEKDDDFYKLIIPKDVKLEIRDKLDYINISERVIYPGLDGICSWITRRYANLKDLNNKSIIK